MYKFIAIMWALGFAFLAYEIYQAERAPVIN